MIQRIKKKIGIMGGKFDPVHNGHLLLAESAYEQFHLDRVIFLPSGNPPHKENVSYLDAEHRVNMVKLAIADNYHFGLSLEEVERPGITYTADTLRDMRKKEPATEFYFIIGADSLFTFETWHQPERICKYCTILVATREGHDSNEVANKINELRKLYKADFFRIISPDFDISSRLIRERFASKRSVKYFIPQAVEKYIRDNELYSS